MLALLACFVSIALIACFAFLRCFCSRRSVPPQRCVSLRGKGCMPTSLPRFVAINCSLEASGQPLGPKMAPLGSPWAPTLLPDTSRRGPGASQKFILAALERPWSEKWIDFGLLEGPREGPGGGLGGHLGSFLAVGPAGTKKKQKSHNKVCFFGAVFACVFLPLPCVFCSPRRSPARKHNLKICLKPLVFTI